MVEQADDSAPIKDGEQDSTEEEAGAGGEASNTSAGRPEIEVRERKGQATNSTGEDLRVLESVLKRTARQLRRPVILEGALWYGVTLLAVVLSGLVAAALISDHGYAIGRWIMVVGSASATVGAAVALGLYWWRRPGLDQVARRVQRHAGEFRSDLVAALEFGRAICEDGGESLKETGYSPSMARAHLSRTVRKVYEASDNASLAHLVPSRDLTPPIMGLSAALVLVLIPFFIAPGWTLGVISGERVGDPVVGERVAEETIVGHLEGVFVYPAYTGRDRQIRQLGTGYIESLEGTEVHLTATLMRSDWASVEMVVECDDGEREVIDMGPLEGSRLSTSLTLVDSGHYWFRGETLEGRPVEEPAKRRIEVRRNNPPQVEVTSHAGRVEVQPDDYLEFTVEVSDDIGIDSVRKMHYFQGFEDDAEYERINLPDLSTHPTHIEETISFDLGPLQLEPKDAVVVVFEARDNNSTTGPGVGESDPIVLYVESPEDKHMRNIAQQQRIMEALLGHLADFLEAPVGEREIQDDGTYRQRVTRDLEDRERVERYRRTQSNHNQRSQILESMDEVVERLEDDPMMVPRNMTLFRGLANQLKALHDDGDTLFKRLDPRAERRDLTTAHVQELADYAGRTETELENGILNLEELLISQRMELVEATAEDIERLRDRLRDLLEQYRDTDDPELREAIEREIQRMRQRLSELMQRMQMQLREMPQEHVNLEAMENMDMAGQADDLGSQLDAIEDFLDDGDIDAAIDALDDMEAHLDAMSGDMSDSFQQMQPRGLSELDQAVSEMMDELNLIREREEGIEESTRELQEDLREARREELERMLEPVVQELLDEIAAQKEQLQAMEERELSEQDRAGVERGHDAVQNLEEMVEQRDMEQALERARQAQRALRSMRNTMRLSERYVEADSQQGRDIRDSLRGADESVERADRIEERIEDFMDQAQRDLQPGEEQRFDELADEQGEVRERAQQLEQQIQEQGEQYPELQQELGPSIEGARQAMEGAEEQLRERRAQRALDDEREALQHLGELGESMSQALEQQRQREREESGHSRGEQDEVEIPGEDSGEMRERLRQEMMEGMREGRAEEYESEIERYFRSLVE